jgi:hypothetical protein
MNTDKENGKNNRLPRAAEKLLLIVIPSEARDLLLRKSEKKADSSGKIRPRNDKIGFFPQSVPVVFCPVMPPTPWSLHFEFTCVYRCSSVDLYS